MEKQDQHNHQRELHLLPPPPSFDHHHDQGGGGRSHHHLDLQLSIRTLQPITRGPPKPSGQQAVALRWQAAEQARMAAVERAYVERMRELTRRELEMAQAELARARLIWEAARGEVARAHFLRENAIVASSADSDSCFQITCHSCSHRFRP